MTEQTIRWRPNPDARLTNAAPAATLEQPEPAPRPDPPDPIARQIAEARATMWISREAETIPGVRRALHVIAGTISAFRLTAWRGNTRLEQSAFPWLSQPDPQRTSTELLALTVRDGIWFDRAHWRKVGPGQFRRVDPTRISEIHDPDDVDAAPRHLLDGNPVDEQDIVNFRWAGLGGIRKFGAPLLAMYLAIMEAAGRYADEPVPSVVLHNRGADLIDDEIDELLNDWELARQLRRAAYLNAVTDLETPGYSARDLQLVELTESIVRDVARLFGLPAASLDVSSGDSMTYANVVEARRDRLEAVAPWAKPIEATLSQSQVTIDRQTRVMSRSGRWLPYGVDARFDTADYLREPFETRIAALSQAITAVGPDGTPLMTVEEARSLEPSIPAPTAGAAT